MVSDSKLKIGFLGGVNAMSMAYALRFIRDGFDVKYVVDAMSGDYLNRPEFQYSKDVAYPYPDWIIEEPVSYRLGVHAHAQKYYANAVLHMQDRNVIFLNHYGLAVADKLPRHAHLIALSSGSDIDVYCNIKAIWPNAFAIRRKWLWPASLVMNILRTFRQKKGLRRVSSIVYFPPGLNVVGDEIIKNELRIRPDVAFIPRFDVDFNSTGTRFVPVRSGGLKKILVPVRFNMSPNSGNYFEYKGNDIIIEALGRYAKVNNEVQIFLVNKGPQEDLARARQLCHVHGISEQVVWLDQMPLMNLLSYYYESDVCIDQVGSHWMGAVGAYALFCGVPLIANWRPDVFGRMWGKDAPIMQAKSVEEIYDHLIKCENFSFREELSLRGHKFANDFLSAEATYKKFLKILGV